MTKEYNLVSVIQPGSLPENVLLPGSVIDLKMSRPDIIIIQSWELTEEQFEDLRAKPDDGPKIELPH